MNSDLTTDTFHYWKREKILVWILLKENINFVCFLFSLEHPLGNQVAWIIFPLRAMTFDV